MPTDRETPKSLRFAEMKFSANSLIEKPGTKGSGDRERPFPQLGRSTPSASALWRWVQPGSTPSLKSNDTPCGIAEIAVDAVPGLRVHGS